LPRTRVPAVATHNRTLRADKAPSRHELRRCKDYIARPRDSGYRGIHLVYKFRTTHEDRSVHNGQRIEIQIRTQLQHVWATADEIVGAFTKQALKSGQGSNEWQQLFALVSSAFSIKERRPLVPGTPDGELLYEEIRNVSRRIQAEPFLAACSEATVHIEKLNAPAVAYLLVLDIENRRVSVRPQTSMLEANDRYAELEKENSGNPNTQTVLVSVDSIGDLQTAYPNYYLDVSRFLHEVRSITGPWRAVLSEPKGEQS